MLLVGGTYLGEVKAFKLEKRKTGTPLTAYHCHICQHRMHPLQILMDPIRIPGEEEPNGKN